jgi:hypothetical protein
MLSRTRQSLLASDPPNDAAALDSLTPASPPNGKLMLRNDEIKAAGLDKLLSAPANFEAVPSAPCTAFKAPLAMPVTVFIPVPISNAIDFSFLSYI